MTITQLKEGESIGRQCLNVYGVIHEQLLLSVV